MFINNVVRKTHGPRNVYNQIIAVRKTYVTHVINDNILSEDV